MRIREISGFIIKTLAVSIVMLIVTILVSMIRPLPAGQDTGQDSGKTMLLLFVVTTVSALVIGLVVNHSRGKRWQLILGLIFAFFGVQTVVGQIEAFFFFPH